MTPSSMLMSVAMGNCAKSFGRSSGLNLPPPSSFIIQLSQYLIAGTHDGIYGAPQQSIQIDTSAGTATAVVLPFTSAERVQATPFEGLLSVVSMRSRAYRRHISGGGSAMSIEDNKNLVRRFYSEIDAGNLDAMDELVAEDYLDHSPPPFPGVDASGREGLKQAFRLFWDATPGVHQIEDQIAEGDKVVTRLTAVGTHRGDLPGIPATGNEMRMTATVVHRIENGRLAEKWSDKDVLAMLQQLNVIPPLT